MAPARRARGVWAGSREETRPGARSSAEPPGRELAIAGVLGELCEPLVPCEMPHVL